MVKGGQGTATEGNGDEQALTSHHIYQDKKRKRGKHGRKSKKQKGQGGVKGKKRERPQDWQLGKRWMTFSKSPEKRPQKVEWKENDKEGTDGVSSAEEKKRCHFMQRKKRSERR